MRDAIIEIGLLSLCRQFAVEKQVANFEKVAVLRQLLDREIAVKQDPSSPSI